MRRMNASAFDKLQTSIKECRRCPRLVKWREQVAREKRAAFRDHDYWGRPVQSFGDPNGHILVVGLAPAAHGANRTGRMFTGDRSGDGFTVHSTRLVLPINHIQSREMMDWN
jgi:uracil-DNA glycosylase